MRLASTNIFLGRSKYVTDNTVSSKVFTIAGFSYLRRRRGAPPLIIFNALCTFNCIYVMDRMLVRGSNNLGSFYSSELGGVGGGVE